MTGRLNNGILSRTLRVKKATGELGILATLGLLGIYIVMWSESNLPEAGSTFGGSQSGVSIGPRFFPQIAGATMAVVSAYLIVRYVWRRRNGTLDDELVEMKVQDLLRVLAYFALIVSYLVLFRSAGFFIATTGLLFVSISMLGRARGLADLATALGLSVAFAVLVYVLFVLFLKLPVPDPILGRFI